jgi:hypothetical protein
MSIFTKPVSEIGTTDLQELIQDSAVENARLEFKLQVPTKDETLKKLSSFANTFGGSMVVGASAASDDGRITALPGVEVEAGYKQKLVDWCFAAVSPPLVVEVSDPIATPTGGGKVCYIVRVEESDVAPHFLNGRKGAWVRTDEFSARFEARLADETELRHLLDRRKVIRERRAGLLERAQKRFDTYASKLLTNSSGNRGRLGAFAEFCVVPRFPARRLCEEEKLRAIIQGNTMAWRQVIFPNISRSGILCQHESAIVLNPMRDLSVFEANVWGMLFYCARVEGEHDGTSGIHRSQFVGNVLLFVRHAGKMLKALGYSGPTTVIARLGSMLGVPWLYDAGGWLEPRTGSELDDQVSFSITASTDALLSRPDAVAMDVLRYVLYSVNAPDLVEKPENFAALIQKGYAYNVWPPPVVT